MTLASLAAAAKPWGPEQLELLETRVRGHLLRDWGSHVVRRSGIEAVVTIRELTGITTAALPDSPDVDAWYPARYQIALTDTIVTEFLDGDYLALEALLLEDATRKREKVVRWVAARIGPRAVFKKASKGHRELYSRGEVAAKVGRRDTTLTWTGALLFDNPTWRMIQMMGTRLMLRVMKRRLLDLHGTEVAGGQGFQLRIVWE